MTTESYKVGDIVEVFSFDKPGSSKGSFVRFLILENCSEYISVEGPCLYRVLVLKNGGLTLLSENKVLEWSLRGIDRWYTRDCYPGLSFGLHEAHIYSAMDDE